LLKAGIVVRVVRQLPTPHNSVPSSMNYLLALAPMQVWTAKMAIGHKTQNKELLKKRVNHAN
jgi:hypothetical protein